MARLISVAAVSLRRLPVWAATLCVSAVLAGFVVLLTLVLQDPTLFHADLADAGIAASAGLAVLALCVPSFHSLFLALQGAAAAPGGFALNAEQVCAMLTDAGGGASIYDRQLRLAAWNAAFAEILRLPEDGLGAGRTLAEVLGHIAAEGAPGEAEARDLVTHWMRDIEAAGRQPHRLCECSGADGRRIAVHACRMAGGELVLSASEAREAPPAPIGAASAGRSGSPDKLAEMIDCLPDGVVIWGPDDRLVVCNQRYRELNAALADILIPGLDYGDYARSAVQRGLIETGDGDVGDLVRDSLERHRRIPDEFEDSLADGRWARILRRGLADGSVLAVWTDISRIKEAEATIRRLELIDPLTGLPNRNLFQHRLSEAVDAAQRLNRMVAVMFVDLDRFKPVNDTYGHRKGDEMLIAVAERLKGCIRKVDTVARLSGDEFAVILTNLQSGDAINVPVKRIMKALAEPVTLDGREHNVAASVGVSVYPTDDTEPTELIRKADFSLFQAKAAGPGAYRLYDKQLDERARTLRRLEDDMRQALREQQFELYYQPQLDISGNRLIGVEALIRWHHPERGMILPEDFVPGAEASGLIVAIGDWALRMGCRQAREWRRAGLPPFLMAVNVSPRQFQGDRLISDVKQALEGSGLEPEFLELEINESMVMDDVDQVVEKLHLLANLGVNLSIDDFGTGYSSLAYLKRFPVHRLKIDRSFVADLTSNPDDAAITEAVIRLGHSLGLAVVAEGVETESHMNFLRAKGCDQVQGYLFAEPMPADDLSRWIAERDRLGDAETKLDPAAGRPGDAQRAGGKRSDRRGTAAG